MNIATAKDRDSFWEYAAAELTDAAYPVMLHHGAGKNWLDLDLDLWNAMIDTVKKLQKMESVSSPGALPNTWDGFG
jgi:hypothetical protein